MTITDIQALPPSQGLRELQLPEQVRPDTGDQSAPAASDASSLNFGSVLEALSNAGAVLDRAGGAENAFVRGTGGLQEMVFERAKADALVSVAAATTSRVAQSLNTISQIQL